MAIAVVGSAFAVAATGDLSVPLPSGLQVGDVLVVACIHKDNVLSSMGAEWTQLYTRTNSGGVRAGAWWHRYDGSTLPGGLITRPAGNGIAAGCTAYRGCLSSGTPVDAFANQINAVNAVTITYPSVVTAGVGDRVVFVGHGAASGTLGAVGGTDPVPGVEYAATTALGSGCGVFVSSGEQSAAGATGARTATHTTSARHVGAVIALKAAPVVLDSGASGATGWLGATPVVSGALGSSSVVVGALAAAPVVTGSLTLGD